MSALRSSLYSDSGEIHRVSLLYPRGDSSRPDSTFKVTVLFTTVPGTHAALAAAGSLARDLGATVELVMLQSLPYSVELGYPPVPVRVTLGRLHGMVSAARAPGAEALLVLCRDVLRALPAILQPHSLVLLGGRKRWWRSKEERLARLLERQGYQVVFEPLARGCGSGPDWTEGDPRPAPLARGAAPGSAL